MMRKMNFICVITGNYHDKRSSWVEKSMGVVILLLFFCQNGSKKVLGGDHCSAIKYKMAIHVLDVSFHTIFITTKHLQSWVLLFKSRLTQPEVKGQASCVSVVEKYFHCLF